MKMEFCDSKVVATVDFDVNQYMLEILVLYLLLATMFVLGLPVSLFLGCWLCYKSKIS